MPQYGAEKRDVNSINSIIVHFKKLLYLYCKQLLMLIEEQE